MKGLSIALRVIAILGAAAAAFFWYQTKGVVQQKEKEIAQLTDQKEQVSDLNKQITAEKDSLQGQINSKDLEVSEAKSQVRFANEQVGKLKRDLGKIENDLSEKVAELADVNSQFTKLREEVIKRDSIVPTQPNSDPDQLKQYQADIDRLEEEKIQLKDRIALLENQIKTTTGGVGVAGDPTAPAGPNQIAAVKEQDASILRTDMERGILIISRGQADGLQQQMQFDIAKGLGKKVRVKVGTVTPTYSVAYVLPGEDPSYLQQGDSVRITQ